MRTRHRVPILFTLSMMDVFCCALGCVILLWLWNDRMAKQKAKAAGQTQYQLDDARAALGDAKKAIEGMKDDLAYARRRLDAQDAALAEARKSIDSLTEDLTNTRGELATLTTDRDRLRDQLADQKAKAATAAADRDRLRDDLTATRKSLDERARDLKDLQAKADTSADLLAKKMKEYEKYAAEVDDYLAKKKKDEEKLSAAAVAARKQVLDLETLVRQKEALVAASLRKTDDLTKQLHDTEGTLKQLRSQADAATGLRSDIDAQSRKLTAAEARVRELEKDLTNRKTVMLDVAGKVEELRGENTTLSDSNKKLTDQVTRLRLAADNRFAGIQLTGRRVVLLVDMSGSMKLSEERVPAPDKWPGVAETAGRILKSLNDLEKFQVIMFAEQVTYPLGGDGQWLDFDPATSPDRVRRVIANTVPQGGTNMFIPMEAAFALRSKGLDTIYLLSDGLPNEGPGLSAAEQARNLNEQQRGEILGKHIRATLKQTWNKFETGKPQVRINSIGFFYESPDVGAFLWALSRENDGSFVGMR